MMVCPYSVQVDLQRGLNVRIITQILNIVVVATDILHAHLSMHRNAKIDASLFKNVHIDSGVIFHALFFVARVRGNG